MKVVLNFELQSWKGYKDNTIIKNNNYTPGKKSKTHGQLPKIVKKGTCTWIALKNTI